MCHCAVEGNLEEPAGENVGGSLEAGDVACARSHEGGFGALSPAQSEFNKQLVWSGQHRTGRLRCESGGKVQEIDESRFDKLRLWQRSKHLQNRFFREKD